MLGDKDAAARRLALLIEPPPPDAPIQLDWKEWHYTVLPDGRAAMAGENGIWTLDFPMGRRKSKGRAADLEAAKQQVLGAAGASAVWRRIVRASVTGLLELNVVEEAGPVFFWRLTAWASTDLATGKAETPEAGRAAAEAALRELVRLSPEMRARHEQLRGQEEPPPRFSKPPGVAPASRVFGQVLRRMRTNAGMNFTTLADHLGVAYSYIHDVEEGKREPLLPEEIDDAAFFMGVEAELLHAAAKKSRPAAAGKEGGA
jgi:DNA-binding XRE family transcriptional regulator